MLVPGPRTHDGLMYAAQDPSEGAKTRELIDAMIRDLTESRLHSPLEELRRDLARRHDLVGPSRSRLHVHSHEV